MQQKQKFNKIKNRNNSIDTFRGITILGMIFFTLTLKLSKNLPEYLKHNVYGSVHLGDFILPMFLFASGLSLAYFIEKREKQKNLHKDVLKRFGKLALIGISLSYFSAYNFLEMDEIMLSALSFVICIAFYRFNWKIILGIIFLINLSYLVLIQFDKVSIFIGHYLGGYPAVIYYLPIMLIGLIIGKGIISKGLWCKQNKIILITIMIFFVFFWILTPINKMIVTPSFIMFSILFSLLVFAIINFVKNFKNSLIQLEYIGKKPLRFWLMMHVFFLIPFKFYIFYSKQNIPLKINWPIAIIISICLFILLWIASYILDGLQKKYFS